MWFKKKSVLQADGHYDTEKSADGTTDLRTTTTWKQYINNSSSIRNSGLPSVADAGNYFYLPALGYHYSGQLILVGIDGWYWSSSAAPLSSTNAYFLRIANGLIIVNGSSRELGHRVGKFE